MARGLPRIPRRGSRGGFRFQRSATHTHRGVDLGAPEGTAVYAVDGGRVTHASAELGEGFSGYGGHVVIDTSGNGSGPWLLYAHLSAVDVAPGALVSRGDRVGAVGRTCYTRDLPRKLCGGAHLHFEVSPRAYPQHAEATRLDPVPYLAELDAHPMAPGPVSEVILTSSAPLPPIVPSPPASPPSRPPPARSPLPRPGPRARGAAGALAALAGVGLVLAAVAAVRLRRGG